MPQGRRGAPGLKYYTLAFLTPQSGCTPEWEDGGNSVGAFTAQVSAIQAAGGNVMISFGGESGGELVQTCTNVSQLTAAYQNVVNTYRARNDGNATENFWRGVENITIDPSPGSAEWAVSQADPMRRVQIDGNLVLDDDTSGNTGWIRPQPGSAGAAGSPDAARDDIGRSFCYFSET